MKKFSGLIITFNEENNIAACINSLQQVCTDIVVIDSNSQDKTTEIANRLGAKVYTQAFLGDGPQRSFGLPYCQQDWVINLDADEQLDNDLVNFLNQLTINSLSIDAFETKRRNFIGNRTTIYAGQYPDYVCRIFNRTKTDFSPIKTHSRIKSKNTSISKGHIIHYSFIDYVDMFNKCQKYASWQGTILAEQKKTITFLSPITHGCWTFFRLYFLKMGFLAGIDGLTIAIAKATSSYLKYAIAIEQLNNKKGQ